MKTYEEILREADAYVEKNFPNRHKGYDGRDFLRELMQDGEGGPELDETGLSHTWFFIPSKYDNFASRIDQWDKPVYDEDGDIEDWETVGYDIIK